MAQVLLPIAQTSAAITMPYSSSDAYQSPSTQSPQRASQMPRNHMYNSTAAPSGYRGTSAPIAPYAFSATPSLRVENRSASAPSVPQQGAARLGHPSHPSSSSDSTVSTSGSSNRSLVGPIMASKDDLDMRKTTDDLPPSLTLSTTIPDSSLSMSDTPTKAAPGRYRRGPGRTDSSSNAASGASTPTQRSTSAAASASGPALLPQNTAWSSADLSPPIQSGHIRPSSADDSQIARAGGLDAAKRYRRRSFNGLEEKHLALNVASLQVDNTATQSPPSNTAQAAARPASRGGQSGSRPASSHSHERKGSVGSVSSNTSARSQVRPEATTQRSYASVAAGAASKTSEPARRHAPSPLSHPVSSAETPGSEKTPAASSAAVKQLNAVNEKDKGVKSRLRRAFSFGSAAELRRASAQNNISAERARLRKEKYQNNEDAEQAAIIAKQEAAGIGAGIYSGQGGIGSTDNLSIQSAASSASIMLRKMGHGMKKGTKSIKGLFRPKSVIGVPAADGPATRPTVGEVALVNVEAERQKVNVNLDPHDQAGGGTGYPRLERNSIDTGRSAENAGSSASAGDAMSRKSIVGGDRERAEILSSMKKGILKRAGTNSESGSPVLKPVDRVPSFGTQRSNSPVTVKSEVGQARNDDYFAKPPRIPNGSTRSLPTTPHGGLRNISFSPRIQFHDAWSPQDYDRRGEIATCNRLTPMLAQQIKEELNSFKMEMEVHEQSKPHTHFF